MNIQLPKQIKSSKGFTLVELLVVIAIIAILAAVGLVIFSGQQKNARDAKRKADIDAIATALENKKTPGAASYTAVDDTWFVQSKTPTDPGSNGVATYCFATAANLPSAGSWVTATNSCPTAPGTWNGPVANGSLSGASTWTICAHLEVGGNDAWYCKSNAQS